MKDEDLMRRISEALDAGGLDSDAGLRAALADDPAAAAYATDLESIGRVLGEMAPRAEPDWDTLFSRIGARLDSDEVLEDIGDPAQPPVFTDLDAMAAEAYEPQVTASSQAVASSGSAKVVDLATRRRRTVFASIGGLAAAAAVGLGIMVGLSNNSMAPSEGSAAMPAAAQADGDGEVAVESTDRATEEEGMANVAMERRAMRPHLNAPVTAEMPTVNAAEPPTQSAVADDLRQAAGARRSRASAAPAPAAPLAPAELAPAAEPRADLPGRARAGGAVASGRSSGLAPSGPAPTASPSRAEVVNALNTVAVRVQECMNGREATARFHLRVDGASGRVVSAAVRPPFRGVEARCMVGAVRSVRMPVSGRGPYEVDHAYHPAPAAGGSLRGRPPATRRARARGGSSSILGGGAGPE